MTEQEKSVREEARKWVERLRQGSTPEDRILAASQLRRLGVHTRGEVATRGSLSQAGAPLVSHRDLEDVLEKLREQPAEVRGEVAFALGEAGGEDIVQPLAQLAKDPESSVRLISADALGRIGGPEAVQALISIAKSDPNEDVRALAVEALGSLAIHEQKAAVRLRGAIRTRGKAPTRPAALGGADVRSLTETLGGIAQEDPSSHVRDTVHTVLTMLRNR